MSSLNKCFGLLCLLGLLTCVGCSDPATTNLHANVDLALEIREGLDVSGDLDGAAEESGSIQEPVGWATLRGRFSINGERPLPVAIKIDKDIEICAPSGKSVFSQDLVIGENDGIGNIAIFLTSKISPEEPWTHPSAKPGKTDEVVFDQKGCRFLSHVLALQASQPLKILNSDRVGHNTNLQPKKNAGFNQNVPTGGSATYQPTAQEPAPFRVSCSIHPWMGAWIMTRKNSYFSVTREDGGFAIPNLPAGVDLEFRVWQEKLGFVQNVMLDDQSTTWSKGRFSKKLDPQDENKNQMNVQIDVTTFN